ncbi:MAG: hypothetical protein WBH68_03630 [Erysipelotrichaceae bacterium]|jgi:Flp pilus assembly pilin Flp|nr:Flp family type IVb pilin [Bacillota bacterium]NLP21950.1 Flp family type IVb pilin [Erysipelotrichaceae bacterium]HCY06782.1 Flp family type IVb pilin [Erysipelotrichaceae bacterium]
MKEYFIEESGQSMTEYALILSLVFLAAIGAVILAGKNITDIYTETIKPTLEEVLDI